MQIQWWWETIKKKTKEDVLIFKKNIESVFSISMFWLSSCSVVNFCSRVALLFFFPISLSSLLPQFNEKVLKPSSLSIYLPNPFSLFLSSLCLHCRSNIKILMHHRDWGWGVEWGIWSKKKFHATYGDSLFGAMSPNHKSFVLCLLYHKPSCTCTNEKYELFPSMQPNMQHLRMAQKSANTI